METILKILGAWFVLSVPVSLIVGRILARASEACPEVPMSSDVPTRY